MKRMQRVFGDLDVLRFVDARLDDDRKAAFLSHLAEDPAEAERVAIWSRQNETIRAAFAGVALESVPVSLRLGHLAAPARPIAARPKEVAPAAALPAAEVAYLKDAARRSQARGVAGYRIPLGAVILFAMAVLVVYVAHGLLPPSGAVEAAAVRPDAIADALVSRASEAHATYAIDPLHPVEFTAAQSAQLTRWIKERLGVAVPLPDFAPEGWNALGGRLVPGSDGPAAFFVYENAAGERLSLFVERAKPFPLTTVALGAAGGSAAAMSWGSGQLAYVLNVEKSVDWLSRSGEALRDRIGAPAR